MWSQLHEDLLTDLYSNTTPSLPVVADIPATVKFLNEIHGPRMVAELTGIGTEQIRALADRHGVVQIAFFDRDDSDYWVGKAIENRKFLDSLSSAFASTRKFERRFPGLGVLQIWNVTKRP